MQNSVQYIGEGARTCVCAGGRSGVLAAPPKGGCFAADPPSPLPPRCAHLKKAAADPGKCISIHIKVIRRQGNKRKNDMSYVNIAKKRLLLNKYTYVHT